MVAYYLTTTILLVAQKMATPMATTILLVDQKMATPMTTMILLVAQKTATPMTMTILLVAQKMVTPTTDHGMEILMIFPPVTMRMVTTRITTPVIQKHPQAYIAAT